MPENKGLIFDIQGHSVHDGPGCRTLIFMSGCPLRCEWCANPEGMEFKQRLMYQEQKCVNRTQGCTRCLAACPRQAISINNEGEIPLKISRELCQSCTTFDCTKVCYFEALTVSGKWMTLEELMRIINRDRQYWGQGGGVTFTGGEPLFQKDFTIAALKKCQSVYIHTAIETSAHIQREAFLKAMGYVDFAFIDIKHMDPEKHREKTGVTNELILGNITALVASGWPNRLIIRLPVIENFNDTDTNIIATAAFLNKVGLREINILPFHRLGDSKWMKLGLKYPYREYQGTTAEKMEHIKGLFQERGIACYTGSDTPF